jgi:hypothetical protein
MPTIRLANDDDMRAIDSRNLPAILELPHLYIPTADGEVMKGWGVAMASGDGSVAVYERLYPGGLVAPKFMGKHVDRGELLYHGAEPAADFVALPG